VLDQTYTDYEIIIVDNNSSDNTEEVVRKYLIHKNISYYKNSSNLGIIGNFNKCLSYAKGEYIKYLMADDKFHPRLLEKFVPIMEQYPNVSLITSNWEMFDLKSTKWILPFKYLQEGKKVINDTLYEAKGNWLGAPTTVMFRRDKLPPENFSPKYTCLADLNMWLQLLSVGDCYIIPETLSYFRVHEGQVSDLKNFENWFDEYRFYKDIVVKNNYNVKESNLMLDKVVKKKAERCAKVMYKMIPKLLDKRARKIFIESFKIASAEKVLFDPLFARVNKQAV
jgi:glycosyltransferase involved in cell wall biosynthesis